MQRSEIRETGRLAANVIGGVGILARDVHLAVADRIFGALGTPGVPVRVLHDGITKGAHQVVRAGVSALPHGAAQALALRAGPGSPAAGSTVRGGLALSAVNGYVGDALAAQDSPLAIEMAFRLGGRDLVLEPEALAAAHPDATGRLAIFVHGLAETEDSWRLPPIGRGAGVRRSYGERLRDELGYTPLTLRYNTGRHISDNGRQLAELVDAAVAAWPVAVDEVILVGHSMGGLVARSACHWAEQHDLAWAGPVRHVFTLGTPHLGADLEKGVNVIGWALSRLPETAPLGRVVNGRSVGIKDLRFGSLAEADWDGHDPDEYLRDRCQEVPFLPDAAYYFIGATLSPAPLGRALGDLLVRLPSASGTGKDGARSIPFELDNGRHLEGLTHFDLLNHPAVYEQMHSWLTKGSAALNAGSARALPAAPR
jgi:pimeloyl-ACP methyl ester carboxylesterase